MLRWKKTRAGYENEQRGRGCGLLHLFVGEILVAGKDVALELVHVGIPELGGLAVEGRGAERRVSGVSGS